MASNISSDNATIRAVLGSDNVSGVKMIDHNFDANEGMVVLGENITGSGDSTDPEIITGSTTKLAKVPLLYSKLADEDADLWDRLAVRNSSEISLIPHAPTTEEPGLFSWPFQSGAWAIIITGGILVFLLVCCFCYFRSTPTKEPKRDSDDYYRQNHRSKH